MDVCYLSDQRLCNSVNVSIKEEGDTIRVEDGVQSEKEEENGRIPREGRTDLVKNVEDADGFFGGRVSIRRAG